MDSNSNAMGYRRYTYVLPPGRHGLFVLSPGGGRLILILRCSRGYQRGRGVFVENGFKNKKSSFPGDNTTVLPLFRPLVGGRGATQERGH